MRRPPAVDAIGVNALEMMIELICKGSSSEARKECVLGSASVLCHKAHIKRGNVETAELGNDLVGLPLSKRKVEESMTFGVIGFLKRD